MKHIVLRTAAVVGAGWLACQFALDSGQRPAIQQPEAAAADAPVGPRQPLTTSHVTGAPEPPPPYITPRIFSKLHFEHPLEMVAAPGSDRWFVVEQGGRIFSFPNRQGCDHADLLLDIPKQIRSLPENRVVGDTYGLAFHPKFAENHYCYVCYIVSGKSGNEQLPGGTRVSRFRVSESDPPRIDPASEKIIIAWLGGGHNGGSLKFGPDGLLYISTGDGGNPNPPDPHNTGQDISDLLSSILRIDVDHASGDLPYTIPSDNPFVKTPGARGEVWAYGLRNPWRMSFDRQTGDLWVGDVGWELWESIDRVKKGGNYGWSITEGPQPVYPDRKRGPTPILPPNVALPHTEACCIIGGYVYRGKRFKDLVGAYICGDWETRRMWAMRFEGDVLISRREIANLGPRIVAFGEGHDGELCILDYDLGTIHELRPNPDSGSNVKFPTKLSETGLFASVAEHRPAAGLVPFSIIAEQWADHATAERFIALPGLSSVEVHSEPIDVPGTMFKQQFMFPKDGVLMKTFWIEMESGNPASRRRLETQLLHFNGHEWRGYSYRWNDEQTDATLVEPAGQDRVLSVVDPKSPGGKRVQTWHYPSRHECLMCHNPWTDYRLAFTLPQLSQHDQLSRLDKMAVIKRVVDPPEESPDPDKLPPAALVNPYDSAANLNQRARSYLQVNCSHCHQFGAGGTADIDLRADVPLAETKALEVAPKQGMFGIKDARILAPGDPYRSVLYYRTSKRGHGRMPHLGSELVDVAGVGMLHDWIRQLPIRKDEMAAVEQLRRLDESAPKPKVVVGEPTVSRAQQRAEIIQRLLSSTTSALVLMHAMDTRPLPPALHHEVVAAAYSHSDPQIRDLFERFVPAEKRVQRLGSVIDAARLVAVPGDAERGRAMFLAGTAAQCKNCHRIGDQGGKLAPDLSHIGKKFNRAQILAKIVEPSKTIEPAFAAWLVQTDSGKSYLGILVQKTASEVILRDVEDKQIHIPASDVEQMIKQSKSLMPEQLLRDMTAQQAADLLSYLETLK